MAIYKHTITSDLNLISNPWFMLSFQLLQHSLKEKRKISIVVMSSHIRNLEGCRNIRVWVENFTGPCFKGDSQSRKAVSNERLGRLDLAALDWELPWQKSPALHSLHRGRLSGSVTHRPVSHSKLELSMARTTGTRLACIKLLKSDLIDIYLDHIHPNPLFFIAHPR